jgi:hypothetical protein
MKEQVRNFNLLIQVSSWKVVGSIPDQVIGFLPATLWPWGQLSQITRVSRKENYHSHISLISGSLVERNTMPQGFKLTNPFAVGKPDATDLVELAREIQRVSTNH